MCGDEFEQRDIRKEEPVCGKQICKTNYEYYKRHMSPVDGSYPDISKLNKF